MKQVFDTCEPRPEVLTGDLREEIFAARLKDVIDGKADPVYQDPIVFFDNTYPTDGLKLLLNEALGRVSGAKPTSSPIIRLETSFGGGKTHNLIALYHAAGGHAAPFVDAELIPSPDEVRIVGIVGYDLDPSTGLAHGELKTYTVWGELAYQIKGKEGYELAKQSEEAKSAPGTGLLEELIGDSPTLILIDEFARHLRSAKSVPTATGKSDLAEQTIAFLLSLLEFAASKERTVVVLTLAESSDAFGRETEELSQELTEARRLSARQERVITPTGETEISAIVTHRLFKTIGRKAAEEASAAYATYFKQAVDKGADLPSRAMRAEYAQEIKVDYPFHPELLTTLNRKTSTIPNFQKTRGALRLLAMVVRRLWETKPPHTYLIHPYHLDLEVEDIVNDLTSRLERPRFKQVIEADIVSPLTGSQAHAQVIDEPWLQASKPPYARRTATSAFLHSLTQGVAAGVDPADLALAVLQPDDDPAVVAKAVERLVDTCWFFDWDGHRYRFNTEPSLNKIIADEMGMVGRTKAKAELDRRIRLVWKAGYFKTEYFPTEAGDVDDDAGKPKLAIIHYDAATTGAGEAEPPDLVRKVFEHSGALEAYRRFQNNVLFLVADRDQVDNMVDIAQRYLAIERITGDAERLREFTEEQRKKLKGMGGAAELDVRIAITKSYRYLYYPSADAPKTHGNLAREMLPAQDQGDVNRDQTEVVLRALKQMQKVLTADDPRMAAAFVKAKAWDTGQESISTEELRRAFARRMGLKILLDVNQLKNTIRDGVKNGTWVYYDANEGMGYSKASPPPAVQISDDTILYTSKEVERLGIPIKGEVQPPGPQLTKETCPVCGNPVDQCTCDAPAPVDGKPTRLHAEGAPAQAFQSILDQCHDHEIAAVSRIYVQVEGTGKEGATEVKAMGLAIPQLGKGDFHIEQTMNAEFGDGEYFTLTFSGPWERYRRMKQVTDDFAKEAGKLNMKTTLRADFEGGLEVKSGQFQAIYDVFTTLGFGKMVVDAVPHREEDG